MERSAKWPRDCWARAFPWAFFVGDGQRIRARTLDVELADGVLDVLVYRHFGRWAFMGMVAQMVWHTWVDRRRMPPFLDRHGVYRTASMRVAPGRPAQVDGDPVAAGVSLVEVLPGGLRVLDR